MGYLIYKMGIVWRIVMDVIDFYIIEFYYFG